MMTASNGLQELNVSQQQSDELAAALEGSQSDIVMLSQALEEAQAAFEQRNINFKAKQGEMQVILIFRLIGC